MPQYKYYVLCNYETASIHPLSSCQAGNRIADEFMVSSEGIPYYLSNERSVVHERMQFLVHLKDVKTDV